MASTETAGNDVTGDYQGRAKLFQYRCAVNRVCEHSSSRPKYDVMMDGEELSDWERGDCSGEGIIIRGISCRNNNKRSSTNLEESDEVGGVTSGGNSSLSQAVTSRVSHSWDGPQYKQIGCQAVTSRVSHSWDGPQYKQIGCQAGSRASLETPDNKLTAEPQLSYYNISYHGKDKHHGKAKSERPKSEMLKTGYDTSDEISRLDSLDENSSTQSSGDHYQGVHSYDHTTRGYAWRLQPSVPHQSSGMRGKSIASRSLISRNHGGKKSRSQLEEQDNCCVTGLKLECRCREHQGNDRTFTSRA